MELVVATRNKKKLAEIKEILRGMKLKIISLADYPAAPRIRGSRLWRGRELVACERGLAPPHPTAGWRGRARLERVADQRGFGLVLLLLSPSCPGRALPSQALPPG